MEELEIAFLTEEVKRDVIQKIGGGISPNRFLLSAIELTVRTTLEKLNTNHTQSAATQTS